MKRSGISPVALLACLLLGLTQGGFGQTTHIEGLVFDAETGLPLPFVTIAFTGSGEGTVTDFEGHYSISTAQRPGMLRISFVGYTTQEWEVMRDVSTTRNFALEPASIALGIAEVRPDRKTENPAKPLMQRVADAKESNDPARVRGLAFREYTKLELDVNDISHAQANRWYWGPFQFVFDQLDSSASRVALPLMIAETDAHVRQAANGNKTQTVVHSSRVSGLGTNATPGELAEGFANINLYENRLLLLDRAFTSPLHDHGNAHYRYYILDTLALSGRGTIHLAFVPRRQNEMTFEGELWIDTLTLGIAKVEAQVSAGANLNWVRDLSWIQEYERLDSSWVLSLDYSVMDISISDRSLGAYVRRTLHHSEFERSEQWPDSAWLDGGERVYEEGLLEHQDSTSWLDAPRPTPLSNRELGIYEMVDTVTNMWQWEVLKKTGYFLGTGFIQTGPLEWGAWWSARTYNPIEGDRFRLDLRTSNAFSTRWAPRLYAAYGRTDGRWKAGSSMRWIVKKTPRTEVRLKVQRDMEQFGMTGLLDQGAVLTNALQTASSNSLAEVERYEMNYLKEYSTGWSLFVEGTHRRVAPRGSLSFLDPATGEPLTQLITTEATLRIRFAPGERHVGGEFDRYSLGSERAMWMLGITHSFPGFWGGNYDYTRLDLTMNDRWRMGLAGRMEWQANAGAYLGSAPFPLLEVVPASGTLLLSSNGFNLLNFYELITDQWVRGGAEWHAEGFIFNHLPILRRLGWREVASVQGVYGTWDDRHEVLLELPESTSGLNGVYWEVSAGVENIFQFLRIDAVRRMDGAENPALGIWGWRMGFSAEF
jgi:hypothetical protein